MKKALSYGLIAAMLLGGVIFACSDRKEPAAEKGAIKKMTEETAREAGGQPDPHPIDKARSVGKAIGVKSRLLTIKSLIAIYRL
jgi:hypothetical protein